MARLIAVATIKQTGSISAFFRMLAKRARQRLMRSCNYKKRESKHAAKLWKSSRRWPTRMRAIGAALNLRKQKSAGWTTKSKNCKLLNLFQGLNGYIQTH